MFVASLRTLAGLLAGVALAYAQPSEMPLRILFVGDIMLDGGPGHLVTNGRDPFEHVATVLRDADLTIGNLECSITRMGKPEDKSYVFKAPLQSLGLLKKYFSAVSLANNHSGDYGKLAFVDELTLLRENGIPYFGGGRDEKEARTPLVLTAKGKRVALLAYNDYPPRTFAAKKYTAGIAWLEEKKVIADIQSARQQADYVILFFHWGVQMSPKPEPEQQAQAKMFIDAGADAIIGGHPHVTQTIEWYKGKPIVYSLGNFIFDYYPKDPLVLTGWMARLDLGGNPGTLLRVKSFEIDPAGVPHLLPEPVQTYSENGLVN